MQERSEAERRAIWPCLNVATWRSERSDRAGFPNGHIWGTFQTKENYRLFFLLPKRLWCRNVFTTGERRFGNILLPKRLPPSCCRNVLCRNVLFPPSHTTKTIKFDRIPFDPCNSIKRFDLCPFDQKNSTYFKPPYPLSINSRG